MYLTQLSVLFPFRLVDSLLSFKFARKLSKVCSFFLECFISFTLPKLFSPNFCSEHARKAWRALLSTWDTKESSLKPARFVRSWGFPSGARDLGGVPGGDRDIPDTMMSYISASGDCTVKHHLKEASLQMAFCTHSPLLWWAAAWKAEASAHQHAKIPSKWNLLFRWCFAREYHPSTL